MQQCAVLTQSGDTAQLSNFQGRPGELSPKARFFLWAGKLFPSKFKYAQSFYTPLQPLTPLTAPLPPPPLPFGPIRRAQTDNSTEPPFDRHDWVVTRPGAGGVSARYVIDYYSAPPDEEGNPQFSLDVRPALDSLESINQRIKVGLEEWMKGEGGQ